MTRYFKIVIMFLICICVTTSFSIDKDEIFSKYLFNNFNMKISDGNYLIINLVGCSVCTESIIECINSTNDREKQ